MYNSAHEPVSFEFDCLKCNCCPNHNVKIDHFTIDYSKHFGVIFCNVSPSKKH